jgi:hypothetical protein
MYFNELSALNELSSLRAERSLDQIVANFLKWLNANCDNESIKGV